MNTRKQVLLMSTLLLVSLVIVGIYGAWYPYREVDATVHFDEQTAERGSLLFERQCRACHGDLGEGGLAGGRLPAAPALDRADLQGFLDSTATLSSTVTASATTLPVSSAARFQGGQTILIEEERMKVEGVNGNQLTVERATGHAEASGHSSGAQVWILDAQTLTERSTLITNTITCGRVGTAMPAWSQQHGGPLSDEQIRQLMTLITQDRWDLVEHHVDETDLIDAHLLEPLGADTTRVRVSDVRVFTDEEALRMSQERMRVKEVPRAPVGTTSPVEGTLTLERGILGTTPLDHPEDEEIFRFPEAPNEPAINQASCGQTARPAAPAGTPELIENFEGQTVNVVAQAIAFDTRQINVNTGGRVRMRLDNRDNGVEHNIAVYVSATTITPASPGSVGLTFPGTGQDDTIFDTPSAGNYFFRCDVHPTTMTGTFTVR